MTSARIEDIVPLAQAFGADMGRRDITFASIADAQAASVSSLLSRISVRQGDALLDYVRGGADLTTADGATWGEVGTPLTGKMFGMKANDAADDSQAMVDLIAAMVARGGAKGIIPRGKVRLPSLTLNIAGNYLDLRGEGRMATFLDFRGTGGGIKIGTGFFTKIGGFTVYNVAGPGVEVGVESLGPQANLSWFSMSDIETSLTTGDGFLFRRCFMGDIYGLRSQNAGGYGFNFDAEDSGTKTSLNVRASHAVQAALGGWRLKNICYSEFTALGADRCAGYGYHLENLQNVRLHGGCENAGKAAMHFHYDAADSDLLDGFKGVTVSMWEKDSQWNGTAVAEGTTDGKLATFTAASNTAKCGGVTFEDCSNYTAPTIAKNIQINSGNWHISVPRNRNSGMTRTVGGGSFSVVARDPNAVLNGLNISVTAANTPIANLYPAMRNGTILYGGRITIHAVKSALTASSASAVYELLINRGTSGASLVLLGSTGATAGATANDASFTFSIDGANNQLLASPVGSTTGTFYFHMSCSGNIDLDPL